MQFFNTAPQQQVGEKSSVEQRHDIAFYQSSQELGKLMLETRMENRDAYHNLLGLVEDEDGNLAQINEPLMNKKGAGQLFILIHRLNGKDTFLTKLTDNDVVVTTHRLWKNVIKLLIKNEKEWELPKDRSRWSVIREIVITPIYFAMRRGEDGLEKEFFKATHESRDVVNQNSSAQFKKGGFFG